MRAGSRGRWPMIARAVCVVLVTGVRRWPDCPPARPRLQPPPPPPPWLYLSAFLPSSFLPSSLTFSPPEFITQSDAADPDDMMSVSQNAEGPARDIIGIGGLKLACFQQRSLL